MTIRIAGLERGCWQTAEVIPHLQLALAAAVIALAIVVHVIRRRLCLSAMARRWKDDEMLRLPATLLTIPFFLALVVTRISAIPLPEVLYPAGHGRNDACEGNTAHGRGFPGPDENSMADSQTAPGTDGQRRSYEVIAARTALCHASSRGWLVTVDGQVSRPSLFLRGMTCRWRCGTD